MNRHRGVGMGRLARSCGWVVAAIASHAAGVAAQQPARVMVRARGDTVVKYDSNRVATRVSLMTVLNKIDSLSKVQEELPIGSAEYARVDDQIRAISSSLPGGGVIIARGGAHAITFGAVGDSTRRTPFASSPMFVDVTPRGWLGFQADGVHGEEIRADGFYVQYFVYPTVVSVDPNSPASRVGMQFGDSLIAYNGLDLRRTTFNLTRLVEPGRTLRLTVHRDGQAKEVEITPEKAPPGLERERQVTAVARALAPSRTLAITSDSDRRIVEKHAQVEVPRGAYAGRMGGGVVAGRPTMTPKVPSGILGAGLTDLDSTTALALTQQRSNHGVLVLTPQPGSPAARLGLMGGDIVIAVDDVDIISRSQLFREVNILGSVRPTQLVVVRAGKIEKLTYDPR